MGAWHQYFLRYPGGALNWTAKLGNHWSKVAILYSLHLLEVVEVVCKNLIEGVLKNNSASSILLLIPRKICFPSNILDHPTLSGFRDRRKAEMKIKEYEFAIFHYWRDFSIATSHPSLRHGPHTGWLLILCPLVSEHWSSD